MISDETVKSHIKNIYWKIDVCSQQMLIDMIEAESILGKSEKFEANF